MKKAPPPKTSSRFSRLVWQIIFINIAATFVVLMLNCVRFGWQSAFLPVNLISTIINTNCIGTLCGIVLTRGVPFFYSDSTFLRFAKIISAIFIATLCGIFISNVLMSLLGLEEWDGFSLPSLNKVVFSLIMAFSFGFSAYFYEVSQIKLRRKEIDEANAKTLATEAQLASLESRIHPHFLFNTLNSIAALIREDPLLAEEMVEKLSALLRYSLDSNARSLVTLEQELEITEKYLEIEKARFNNRLIYRIEANDQLLAVKLPPLSLQTLVENSIKHVASKTSGQTEIIVSVKESGENIEIGVRDNGAGFSNENIKENHGLDSLAKRLRTIFDDNATLQIVEENGGYVRLALPKQN